MNATRATFALASALVTSFVVMASRTPPTLTPRALPQLAVGSTARVGTLVYRIDDVRCVRDENRLRVSITLFRADATQTFGAANLTHIRLRASAADRYAPLEVEPIACDGVDDCEVLDPGNSRIDALVFLVPEASAASLVLEVAARPDEPGPRGACFMLVCERFSAASSAEPRR